MLSASQHRKCLARAPRPGSALPDLLLLAPPALGHGFSPDKNLSCPTAGPDLQDLSPGHVVLLLILMHGQVITAGRDFASSHAVLIPGPSTQGQGRSWTCPRPIWQKREGQANQLTVEIIAICLSDTNPTHPAQAPGLPVDNACLPRTQAPLLHFSDFPSRPTKRDTQVTTRQPAGTYIRRFSCNPVLMRL